MITHLTVNDWRDVLEEDTLPIRERLAVAFQFLDDKALPSFLRSVIDQSLQRGDLTGLIITGLTAQGMEILQKFVDVTGDVQTAAIISSLRVPSLISHNGKTLTKSVVDRWVETYQDLLDGWKLFHHRCQFDIERGKAIQEALGSGDGQRREWQPRQVMIRCNLCNKTVDVSSGKGKGVSEHTNHSGWLWVKAERFCRAMCARTAGKRSRDVQYA
jgi:WD repeat-containing protein mio